MHMTAAGRCVEVTAGTSQACSSNGHHRKVDRKSTWLPKSDDDTCDNVVDTEHASIDCTKNSSSPKPAVSSR